MTSIDNVQDITPRDQYTAAAAQAAFTYSFPIFEDANLVVDIDGAIQALTTDYTVIGAGDELGGTVTLIVAASGDEVVTIYRDIAVERSTDFQQNGPWSSVTFNDELDKLYLIIQELENKVGRAIRFPITGAITNAQAELAPISNFKNKFLHITSAGLLEAADVLGAVVTLSAEVIGALLYPQTTAESSASITPTAFRWVEGDLRRYGAVDGADSNAAMASALLVAAQTDGFVILVPRGTWKMTAAHVVPNRTTIRGEGSRTHNILQWDASYEGDGFTHSGPVDTTTHAHLKFQSIKVECLNTTTNNLNSGIITSFSAYVECDDVFVQGFLWGIVFNGVTHTSIHHSHLQGQHQYGVWLVNGDDITSGATIVPTNTAVIGPANQFNNNTAAGTRAIKDDGGSNLLIHGNNFNGWETQIHACGRYGLTLLNNEHEVSGGVPIVFDTTTEIGGNHVQPCGAVTVQDSVIICGTVSEVDIQAIRGITFKDNIFGQYSSAAIRILSDDIGGIVLENNQKLTFGTGQTDGPFISLAQGSSRWRFIDITRQPAGSYVASSAGSGVATVTPKSMENIYNGAYLSVVNADGTNPEIIQAGGVTSTTFDTSLATAKAADWIITGQPLNNRSESFTPTLIGASVAGSQTYLTQNGHLEITGNRVDFMIYLQVSVIDGAMAGDVVIDGLPKAATSLSGEKFNFPVTVFAGVDLTANYTTLSCQLIAGGTSMIIYESGDAVAVQAIDAAVLTATVVIGVQGHYYI